MVLESGGLISYMRPDGIFVFKALDFNRDTLAEWKRVAFVRLEEGIGGSKTLYEMRHIDSLPIRAIRTATDIQTHSNAYANYSVALVSNENVAKVVDMLAGLMSRSHVRVMTDEVEAIRWLNEMMPPEQEEVANSLASLPLL